MIRLDRIQKGFGEILQPFFGVDTEVYWGYLEPSISQLPSKLVIFRLISGPIPTNVTRGRGTVQPLLSGIEIKLDSVVDNGLLLLRINGHKYNYTITPGQTIEQARDSFVTYLNTSPYEEWVASPVGTDSISFVPKAGMGIWSFKMNSHFSLTSKTETPPIEVNFIHYDFLVTIDCMAAKTNLMEGAVAMATRVSEALQRRDVSRKLYLDWGIALQARLPASNLFELVGANWESRSSIDVPFSVLSADYAVFEGTGEIPSISETTVEAELFDINDQPFQILNTSVTL